MKSSESRSIEINPIAVIEVPSPQDVSEIPQLTTVPRIGMNRGSA